MMAKEFAEAEIERVLAEAYKSAIDGNDGMVNWYQGIAEGVSRVVGPRASIAVLTTCSSGFYKDTYERYRPDVVSRIVSEPKAAGTS